MPFKEPKIVTKLQLGLDGIISVAAVNMQITVAKQH